MRVDVCVVGGGLAGLFTAAELHAAGIDVVVLEATARAGGVAQTIRRDGFQLEAGAGSFAYPGSNLGRILDNAGVATIPAVNSSTRYLFDGADLIPIQPGPELLRTPLLSWAAKLRVLIEPLVHGREPGIDETLQSFCVRHFGATGGSIAAWLAASGVFAGDPERLSVGAAFPRLLALERSSGSLLIAAAKRRRNASQPSSAAHLPLDGMDGLSLGLAEALGDRFITEFAVDRVESTSTGFMIGGPEDVEARHLVLALPPESLAGLIGGETADLLSSIDHAPVVVAGLGGPEDDISVPAGFGALPISDSGLATRGVLFESSYAPFRAPAGQSLVKVIAGGARSPALIDQDDQSLINVLVDDVSHILGRDLAPRFVELVRHVPGIPQMNVGHSALVESIESNLRHLGPISLTGWGYRGVGVAQLAEEAAQITREVTETMAAA